VVATAVELLFRAAGREPPVSRRSLRFFTGNTAFDVSRAREVLGFTPRYDVESGLRETLRRLGGGVV
jgi:nucleoside-diphosphate-sugar epimerase